MRVSSVFFTPARPCLLHVKRSKVLCKHGTLVGSVRKTIEALPLMFMILTPFRVCCFCGSSAVMLYNITADCEMSSSFENFFTFFQG